MRQWESRRNLLGALGEEPLLRNSAAFLFTLWALPITLYYPPAEAKWTGTKSRLLLAINLPQWGTWEWNLNVGSQVAERIWSMWPHWTTGKTQDISWRTAKCVLFFFFFYFNWRLITLQYCGGFCHTFTLISHGCTCVPHPEPLSHLPSHPIPQGHPSAPALSTLSHASNLDWRSISHMIIYMFQCYSLKSSHPHLLPQSPKVCEEQQSKRAK